jgi:hypothetical protein
MIITLLRKPLEGTVAENTLQHGCGGLNIDDTRISTSDSLGGGRLKGSTDMSQTCGGSEWDRPWMNDPSKREHYANVFREKVEKAERLGRWPANFMLTHLDGCKLRGTKNIKQGKNSSDLGGSDRKVGLYKDGLKKRAEDRHQGEEEVADWACAEGCPIKLLDEQSGISKSTGGRIGNKQGIYSNQGEGGWSTDHTKGDAGFGDTGGASRFFMQFKKGDDQ